MAGPDSATYRHIWQLFGYEVLDSRGERVGRVERIWTDNATGSLHFVGLTTGWFPRHTRVIPAGDAQIDDTERSIQVGYPAALLTRAPCQNTDIPLTGDQERKVIAYYEIH